MTNDACIFKPQIATPRPPIQNRLPLLLQKATFVYAQMCLYLSCRQRFTTRIRRAPGAICHSGSPRSGRPAAHVPWSAVARHSFGISRSESGGAMAFRAPLCTAISASRVHSVHAVHFVHSSARFGAGDRGARRSRRLTPPAMLCRRFAARGAPGPLSSPSAHHLLPAGEGRGEGRPASPLPLLPTPRAPPVTRDE